MDIKLDENGNAVLADGKPVFVGDDGKDVTIDVDSLFKKIQTVNSESATRKRKIAEMDGKLKVLDGIEDPDEWMDNAKKALETVQNLDDKKLIDADKVDELKKQIKEAYDTKMMDKDTAHLKDIDDLKNIVTDKDSRIYNLMVSSKFASSPYFSGDDAKTVLLPDIAESYFGKHFKVEENDNGELIVAGYIGESRIPSRSNPGEPADFNESVVEIIDQYPMKDRILRAGHSGSGSAGNQSGSGDDNDLITLKKQYSDAMTSGNIGVAISLKNKLHLKGVSVF